MFEETLVRGAKDILAVLGRSDILRDAYLAGGTAAALRLGHRVSVDFDFFTAKKFVPKVFSADLRYFEHEIKKLAGLKRNQNTAQ